MGGTSTKEEVVIAQNANAVQSEVTRQEGLLIVIMVLLGVLVMFRVIDRYKNKVKGDLIRQMGQRPAVETSRV